ncbi:MAG: helix-turn-helix domain-containing protein [Muribaculaceae bacterium]|nr:helix-turn-helix domain-containing protein [Muribaculaceae bacterium]
MQKHDSKAVAGRIKYLLDDKLTNLNQGQLAKQLGIDPSNLSKYINGRLEISNSLINKFVVELGISKDWLTDGIGLPFAKPSHAKIILPDDISPAKPARGVPVYDVDVTAGRSPLERLLTEDRITGYIDMPRINPESIIVRVSGDSMEPKIIDGGFIAVRPIKSTTNIFWGQIYVIVMEEYRMVKYLRRDPNDKSMVILHSANPAYDDMDVARDDIQALFLVESILNFKNLC